jgi:predicted amidohydrolase
MLNVACIQPEILQNRKKCYREIENLLKRLLKDNSNCEIVCLPERWVPFAREKVLNIQKERGEDYQFIRKLAETYSVNLISGGIWEKRPKFKKPFVTSYFFNKNGDEIGRQDKIHLYTYERKNFEASLHLKIFKLKSFQFAILICFDMAFFETPRLAAENGAEILFSPTQIRDSGMFNWDIYLKARALENRIPVVASNTYGELFGRKFPGKSKIISFLPEYYSPSSLRVIEAPYGSNGKIFDEIDIEFANKLRKQRLDQKVEKSEIKIDIITQ